ncbi:hypothetical protein NEICINOT_04776 [Neisseria cinerea ATCC 14685]|uniref:Uncharacterized protein n=1 Tax=Neisseria cinerea ATCC 14685 TaxID=546262 RepID=D0W526_NEICI|nr:hypothetical protein NEICINOT_04776 [Neisseria cinerea ATCC 14685]
MNGAYCNIFRWHPSPKTLIAILSCPSSSKHPKCSQKQAILLTIYNDFTGNIHRITRNNLTKIKNLV